MVDDVLPSPGTIAILHRGEVVTELALWLAKQHERYPGQLYVRPPRGNQIPRQRNIAVEEMWGSWLLFVDSDCVPDRDTLPRLVGLDLDVVGAVVHERWAPFDVAVTYGEPPVKYTAHTVPRRGVHEVRTLGMACTLIRREVFERVARPWFQCGQIDPEYLDEDSNFCLRAAAAGVPIHLDAESQCGHAVTGILWPGKDGRRWMQWPGPMDWREPMGDVGDDGAAHADNGSGSATAWQMASGAP